LQHNITALPAPSFPRHSPWGPALGIIISNKQWIKDAPTTIQIFLENPQDARLVGKIQHAFIDLAAGRQWIAVKAFVDSGVLDINVMPDGRWSALHHAAFAADADAIQMLTYRGANKALTAIPAKPGAYRDVPGAVIPLEVATAVGAPPAILDILR
jgi:hypothetical protein